MSDTQDTAKKLPLMIGMCARARKIIIGCEQICIALKAQKKGSTPLLVLEAADVSENTHKRLSDRCSYYGVQKHILPLSSEELAHCIGKKGGSVAAVAVTDEEMSRAVMSFLPESQNQS